MAAWGAILLLAGAAVFLLARWRPGLALRPETELRRAAYSYPPGETACPPGSRDGPRDGSDHEATEGGVRYSVRVPANYDPTRAHPLLVVYAPRGIDRFLLERFAGLTRVATEAGFVAAYADSVPLSVEVLADLATIPERVARRWCIDETRVFFTGHSDGGTVSSAIAFRRLGSVAPAAIAPSGAGIRGADLRSESCPPPISVRVSHGAKDRLFPGFGREAARWWAQCNLCAPEPSTPDSEGCVEYPRCAGGVRTLYCEHPGGHLAWAERPESLIEFFRGAVPRAPVATERGAQSTPGPGQAPPSLEPTAAPARSAPG